MTVQAPTPSSVARRLEAGRVTPSDGPAGDAQLDDVITHLSESVEEFVTSAQRPAMDGHEASTAAAADAAEEPSVPDAGEVIARAQVAHDALHERLGQAQA